MKINEIIDGLQSTEDLPTFLIDHIATLDHLYLPTTEYLSLVNALRLAAVGFYHKTCPLLFRPDVPAIITKEWLNDHREEWEISDYPYFENTTSGTTAEKFRYRISQNVYYRIELFEHYIAILREFFVTPKRLLYAIGDDTVKLDAPLAESVTTDNAVMTHGLREAVEVLKINKNILYFEDHYRYYDEFFEFLQTNPVELILADGNTVSEMLGWIRKNGFRGKICKLVSSTSCSVVEDDLEELRKGGFIDNWCDHMRCWDGGVTFFSCKYRVRHLVEHFAYPLSIDGKLISQDFFSFSSPFWNYWNGDLVTLGEEYKRCQCGRIYRDFRITREREQNVFGVFSAEMDASLADLDCLKRSVCSGNLLKVFTSRPLSASERSRIRACRPELHYRFVVEP